MTTINMLVEYPTSARVDVELPDGKVWADVQDYHIKYGVLVMWFHDDTTFTLDLDIDAEPDDQKWPSRMTVSDEHGNELDERGDTVAINYFNAPKLFIIASHETDSGDGPGYRIYHNMEDAHKWRDEIARENWDEFFGDLGDFDSDVYWEEAGRHGEWFSVGEATINPEGEAK